MAETETVVVGIRNKPLQGNASVFGKDNTITNKNSSAFGSYNKAMANNSYTFGYKNKTEGVNSLTLGQNLNVLGAKSGALRIGSFIGDYKYKIERNNSWAIGNYNKIEAGSNNNNILGNYVSIGTSSKTITNSVVLANKLTVEESRVVSVGSATLKRKITNIADGEVSATSTDAVNGRRLYNVMENLGTVGIQNLRKEVGEAKDEMIEIGSSLSAALQLYILCNIIHKRQIISSPNCKNNKDDIKP